MEAVGANGRMILEGDRLTISRKGTSLLTTFNLGVQGDKVIPVRSITAVQLKPAGMMRGYIRLSINGRDPVGGGMEAASDENAVLFDKKDETAFTKLRNAIQEAMENVQSIGAPVSAPSAADEIEKLASLRDRGILTEEEFTAKKRQLLGI